MSLLTDIKQKIDTLSAADFQEFCDCIIERIHPEWNIHELGLESGTAKTTIGNPDTYFRIETGDEAGKYVFVAYTTQKKSLTDKIREDISKCLDESKTGLSVTEIKEIVVCHTSANISAGDDSRLHKMCDSRAPGIGLTILGIDELANIVYNRFPSIAADFLHISVGSGQLFDIDGFVRAYDSVGLAAPLDTEFILRENELEELSECIRENRITIVYGHAGVGKTRLALEACRAYHETGNTTVICIRSRGLSLYNDYIKYVEQPGRYLVFIDDADNVKNLYAIVDHAVCAPKDHDIRILMTVRNYIRKRVLEEIDAYNNDYGAVELRPLDDQAMAEFIKQDLGITEEHYVDEIIKIAKGKPRLAYMASKVAKEQSLYEINDSTKLLDYYYEEYVDRSIGDDRVLCITAGILAVVGIITFSQIDFFSTVLEEASIGRADFRVSLGKLVQTESVRNENDAYSYSDQSLSNYMLYYTFLKKRLLSFSEILDIGFRHFRSGVIRATATIINVFRSEENNEYLVDQIKEVWNRYENSDDAELYESFLREYSTADPLRAFSIANERIKSLQREAIPVDIDFSGAVWGPADLVLSLLTGYQNSRDYSKTVLELALEFANTSENNMRQFFNWFDAEYGMDTDAHMYGFQIQAYAAGFLKEHCLESAALSKLCIMIATRWLAYEFHPMTAGRHGTFRSHIITYSYSENLIAYRKNLLETVQKIAENHSDDKHSDDVLSDSIKEFIEEYARYIIQGMDEKIILSEAGTINGILAFLDDDLSKAIVISQLEQSIHSRELEDKYRLDTGNVYSIPEWKLYQLFSRDYNPDDYSDYEEFLKARGRRIGIYVESLGADDMTQLILLADKCIQTLQKRNNSDTAGYDINDGLSVAVRQISDDHARSTAFIRAVQKYGGHIDVRIDPIIEKEIMIDSEAIYDLISDAGYASGQLKNDWQFQYFEVLPKEKCDADTEKKLLKFLSNGADVQGKYYSLRNLGVLLKFLNTDSDIFIRTSEIILEKRSYSDVAASRYFDTLFHDSFTPEFSPEKLIHLYNRNIDFLKKIYAFELRHGQSVDHDGRYLEAFIRSDDSWIDVYTEYLFDHEYASGVSYSESSRMKILWCTDQWMGYCDHIFEAEVNTDPVSSFRNRRILKDVMGHFYQEENVVSRQKEWFLHLIDVYAQSDAIKTVFFISADLPDDFRLQMFSRFLQQNKEADMFKLLPLEPDSQMCTDSWVPVLTRQKEFLLSLQRMTTGVEYLEHNSYLQEQIDQKDRQIKYARLDDMVREVYD